MPRVLLGGRLTDDVGRDFEVLDPATGKVVASVPDCGAEQLDRAVAAATAAQPAWAADEPARRAALHRLADLVVEHAGELATLVALETGKPMPAARMEPTTAVDHIRWLADAELPRPTLVDDAARTVVLEHVPVGVVAAIIPWNVPLVMALHKLAAALRAGNTVVVKPSPVTPLATLRIAELAADVFPPGVVSVLSGGDELGRAMTAHPGIAMIAFTGSVPTGRAIMASAAATLKRVTLELGGNDAAIVLDDVDPDEVAPKLFFSAFVLSGQVCQAIKRLYVHRSRYDDIVDRLAELASSAVLGGPGDEGAALGPLTTEAQLERVAGLVDDARAAGGVIRAGGERLPREGNFYAPTIVTGLTDDARLVAEEQFGPALPVLPFDDVDEVIARANGTEFGLSASVWTSDPRRGAEIARRLVGGSVWVNQHAGVEPQVPFGGMRQSGIGRESGLAGLLGYTETRTVSVPKDAPDTSTGPTDTSPDTSTGTSTGKEA